MKQALQETKHHYPKQVHLLENPYLQTLAAKASHPDCLQPLFNLFIKDIFKQMLVPILNNEWPTLEKSTNTRMTEIHSEQQLQATVFDENQKAVCVDIARAGMLPSQIFFDQLNLLVKPEGLRLDHIFASRITNTKGEVTHTELNSSKIGGDIDQAIVFLPDPMGATGKSLCEVVKHYKSQVAGKATRFVSAHMIITPEFIRTLHEQHPDVIIYAARLDRGFSSKEALASEPGKLWDQEKGLNDSQYIVPGAGGVGELINNSFV